MPFSLPVPPGLTAVDLFSGCGGMTVGLKRAGFHVLGAVEIDALSVETYQANHPEVTQWTGDIRELDARVVRRILGLRRGQLHLLAGCPPCQGFSSLRTLNGSKTVDDPRNRLIHDFLRFATEFLPKTLLLENVPGLQHSPLFDEFQARLGELGYHHDFRVLDAADYGVPQRRSRLLLLAGRGRAIQFAPPTHRRHTVRGAIGQLPEAGKSGDPLHDFPERRSSRILDLIAKIPKNGGSRTDLEQDDQLPCHQRTDGFKDIYGRMAWRDVAPTLTTGCCNPSKGRFLHPEQNRAITLREAALLQTFPKHYKFSLRKGKSGVAAMIGNALPPNFLEAHAREVAKVLARGGHGR